MIQVADAVVELCIACGKEKTIAAIGGWSSVVGCWESHLCKDCGVIAVKNRGASCIEVDALYGKEEAFRESIKHLPNKEKHKRGLSYAISYYETLLRNLDVWLEILAKLPDAKPHGEFEHSASLLSSILDGMWMLTNSGLAKIREMQPCPLGAYDVDMAEMLYKRQRKLFGDSQDYMDKKDAIRESIQDIISFFKETEEEIKKDKEEGDEEK